MILSDLILFHYYKAFTRDGFDREAQYVYQSGVLSSEDRAFSIFCASFLGWTILIACAINYISYHKLRASTGFIVCVLFIPFYLYYSKKYTSDFQIIGVYEKYRPSYKRNWLDIFIVIGYSMSIFLSFLLIIGILIFRIK